LANIHWGRTIGLALASLRLGHGALARAEPPVVVNRVQKSPIGLRQ
jgi:hypothetical protein